MFKSDRITRRRDGIMNFMPNPGVAINDNAGIKRPLRLRPGLQTHGFPKRFELDYLQGDEVEGFEGTCALTSVANLLTQSGKPTTEGDVVRRDRLKSRRWRDGGAWQKAANDVGWKVAA